MTKFCTNTVLKVANKENFLYLCNSPDRETLLCSFIEGGKKPVSFLLSKKEVINKWSFISKHHLNIFKNGSQ